MDRRIDDPDLDVRPDDVLVMRNAGPLGGPGMPEWGFLPLPKKLLQQGVRDMVRISDARMSGTAFGTVVVHATPESAAGGPLAAVRNGDMIELNVPERLGADLPPGGAPYDRDSAAPAVGAVMAAIELVDDRWHDYKAVDTPTLIADDFFGAGCVLGPPVHDWPGIDLPAVEGSMYINGTHVGSGTGADIMGHPFEALAWLANSMAGRGRGLRAGEFVLLGSLVETKWVERGDLVTIEQPGLGTASARF